MCYRRRRAELAGCGRYLLVMARFRLLDRLRRPAEVVREHTVFVFSGGSVRGAAQAGMLRVLLENGIVPDEIVVAVADGDSAQIANTPFEITLNCMCD